MPTIGNVATADGMWLPLMAGGVASAARGAGVRASGACPGGRFGTDLLLGVLGPIGSPAAEELRFIRMQHRKHTLGLDAAQYYEKSAL